MPENAFNKVDYSLQNLIDNIALGKIGLPDIQRPFVWPNVKVRDLFDSMYKGYPVGYFLFWENGQTSSPRQIGTDQKQVPPDLVIVDGQQRLTSLYAVIKGLPVVRSNYKPERIRIAFNPLIGSFEVASAAIERDKSFIPDISILWGEKARITQIVRKYLDGLRSIREVSGAEEEVVENSIEQLRGTLGVSLHGTPTISEHYGGGRC